MDSQRTRIRARKSLYALNPWEIVWAGLEPQAAFLPALFFAERIGVLSPSPTEAWGSIVSG